MKIQTIIDNIKKYHKGEWNGKPIDETKTRDKVLFGNTDQECTNIVTTIYASVDVIKKSIELKANFIICHEALFWYRGDYTLRGQSQGCRGDQGRVCCRPYVPLREAYRGGFGFGIEII